MNIIIIDHEPYSFRKKSHYYIDEFISDGWNVEYWGVNNILKYMKNVQFTYQENDSFIRYFDDMDHLTRSMLKFRSNNTIFIIELLFNKSTIEIFRILKEKEFRWLRIHYYINPISISNNVRTTFEKVCDLKLSTVYSKLKRLVFLHASNQNALNIPDILFVTGNNRNNGLQGKKTISLDYFDVQKYNEIKQLPSPLPYKYIVFLDIMLVNHPDIQRRGYKEFINKSKYFDKLNDFFNKIEHQTKLPVVIASHPKANYSNEFRNRLCIKHKTAELSIHAEFLLTHGSLSISFALLSKKPLVYIYSKDLFSKKERFKSLLNRMDVACQKLGAIKINIDDYDVDIDLSLKVDDEKYDDFLALGYLNSNNALNSSNFNILKHNLTALLNEEI